MTYEKQFLLSLLITLTIEVPVVSLVVRYKYKILNNFNTIFVSFVSTILTLPYFWFILPIYINNRTGYLMIGEIAIILIEAFIYYRLLKISFKKALGVSILANVISFLIGIILLN